MDKEKRREYFRELMRKRRGSKVRVPRLGYEKKTCFELTEEMYSLLKKKAEEKGESLSETIRTIISKSF